MVLRLKVLTMKTETNTLGDWIIISNNSYLSTDIYPILK